MLTKQQQIKVSNSLYSTYSVNIYWNQLCNQEEEVTEQQWDTIRALSEMSKAEQNSYIIIDDKLVKAPTNKKTHQIPVIR